mmetsp:Transcript_28923/g.40325  ORF Transcript_28923/g.40325 Transcript_28923/m.40325 type:complete len:406 (+) Transcript_28923:57-1274(+)
MKRYVRTPKELDTSFIAWPFTRRGTVYFALLSTVILGSLLLAVEICDNVRSCSESAWNHVKEDRNESGDCETVREDRLLGEHINSISNFSFALVGMIAVGCGVADYIRISNTSLVSKDGTSTPKPRDSGPRNHVLRSPLFSFIFGASVWLLTVTSFLFHARRSPTTEQLDSSGYFPPLVAPTIYCTLWFVSIRISNFSFNVTWGVLTTIIIGVDLLLILLEPLFPVDLVLYAFLAMLLLWLGMLYSVKKSRCAERLRWRMYCGQEHKEWRLRGIYLVPLAIVSFGVGQYFTILDSEGVLCDGTSVWQFHSAGHALFALAFMLLYFVLRSEFIVLTEEKYDSRYELEGKRSQTASQRSPTAKNRKLTEMEYMSVKPMTSLHRTQEQNNRNKNFMSVDANFPGAAFE